MPGKSRSFVVTDEAKLASSNDMGVTPRHSFAFFNAGSATIYLGFDSDVTPSTGAPVPPDAWSPGLELRTEEAWLICDTGETSEARVLELGL